MRRAVLALVPLVLLTGCSALEGSGAGGAAERIRASGSPLVAEVRVDSDWLDGDSIYVHLREDATDLDARAVWCDVIVPADVPEGVHVGVDTSLLLWEKPDCADPEDIPAGEPG